MQLQFKVNEDLLIACALFSKRGQKLEGWDKIKDALWESYKEAYEFFLYAKPEKFFAQVDYDDKLKKITDQVPQLFSACRDSDEYKQLLKETIEYRTWLENEWQTHKAVVTNELQDILRIELPQKTYTVQVVSPKVGGGSYLGNQNIFWGHTEDWPNYNVVYLMHEVLHDVIGMGKKQHLVIELVTDNELRKRLNNDDYFENGNVLGHEAHTDDLKSMLHTWKTYLKNTDRTILDFIKEIS